jgi:uncharacterized protein (TIGR02996 family)
MTPDDAFLADIIAAPDDDGLRLIYADYLDERGDPRGEFIRVQIDLARQPKYAASRKELEARERALLQEHEVEWAGPRPRVVTRRWFERGFLAGVEMQAKGFSRLPAVFRSCPTVRELHLVGPFEDKKPIMQEIASSPYLARLTALEIRDGRLAIGPEAVATLAESPHVRGLTTLSLLNNRASDRGLAALAASPNLGQLRTLALSCYGLIPWDFVGTEGVEALASSQHLSRLTTLRLPGCWIGDKGCRVLATAPNLLGLTTLDLSWNVVGDEGVQALLGAPYLARLIKLDLRRNHPLTEAMKELLRKRLGERVVL